LIDVDYWSINRDGTTKATIFTARRRYARTCYGDVAGWLAEWLNGWVSVTRRYCIKTAKPILKLFRPSGCYRGGKGKISDFRAIFDGNRRLSRKRCKI